MKTKLFHDKITQEILDTFTIEKKDYHTFTPHNLPDTELPNEFNIGVIVGSSGSGKSILLEQFGKDYKINWDHRAIASHFKTSEDANNRLLGAGLNSIPMWLVPYNILSTGQKYRADMAIKISDGAVFDEFTSVIDRETAKSLSCSIQKYIRKENFQVVFASVHKDIINYLKPCWVYCTDTKVLTINTDYQKQEIYFDKEYIKPTDKVHFMEFEVNN